MFEAGRERVVFDSERLFNANDTVAAKIARLLSVDEILMVLLSWVWEGNKSECGLSVDFQNPMNVNESVLEEKSDVPAR